MSCWKCGKELPEDQTECPGGCDKLVFAENGWAEIDWDKVKSFEDMRQIFAAIQLWIDPAKHPALRKWLKTR